MSNHSSRSVARAPPQPKPGKRKRGREFTIPLRPRAEAEAMLVVGGVAGTIGGIALGKVLGTRKGLLERCFAAVVIAVGTYVTASSL